jgi:hypothetical protein
MIDQHRQAVVVSQVGQGFRRGQSQGRFLVLEKRQQLGQGVLL